MAIDTIAISGDKMSKIELYHYFFLTKTTSIDEMISDVNKNKL